MSLGVDSLVLEIFLGFYFYVFTENVENFEVDSSRPENTFYHRDSLFHVIWKLIGINAWDSRVTLLNFVKLKTLLPLTTM